MFILFTIHKPYQFSLKKKNTRKRGFLVEILICCQLPLQSVMIKVAGHESIASFDQ